MRGGGGGDDDDDGPWRVLADAAAELASVLLAPSSSPDALADALERATAAVDADDEFVAALGFHRAHRAVVRLTTHPSPDVAAAAGDLAELCARRCPRGVPFPSVGGDASVEPSYARCDVGRRNAPLALILRRAREDPALGGGEKRRVPNIAWPSAIVLARVLARHPALVRGKDVLELGAGLGAVGMAAAALGADAATLTDVDDDAVANMRYNIARGGGVRVRRARSRRREGEAGVVDDDATAAAAAIASRCVAKALDWNDARDVRDVDGTADVVLGADVVHDHGMADGVVSALARAMRSPHGVGLIVNPAPEHRAGADRIPELLTAAGLVFERRVVASALLRAGLEEETEDVKLDVFAIARAEERVPRLEDVGERWFEFD
jgi:predicted nicotinamide N-methyase